MTETAAPIPSLGAPAAPGAPAASRTDEIDGAARAFEQLFVQRMLGDMRRAARAHDDPSDAMSNWESMFDERIAEVVTRRGGLGLGDALSRSLGGSGDVALVRGAATTGLPAADVRALRRLVRDPDAARASDPVAVRRPRAGLSHAAGAPDVGTAVNGANGTRGTADASGAALETGFLAPLRAHAERNARRLGTRPEAILAVAALETGWGRHPIRDATGIDSHNLFGIKATGASRADGVEHRTTEFVGGAPRRIEAIFRRFDGVGEAVDGFADFVLDNPRYAPALRVAHDPERFLRALHGAGYATDPDYADKVVDLMHRVRSLLDTGGATPTPTLTPTASPAAPPPVRPASPSPWATPPEISS